MEPTEFKSYLKSYCAEVGLDLPLYNERKRLRLEFSKNKYSDQMDLECELWDFLDKNLLAKVNSEKKNMNANKCVSTIAGTYATMTVIEDCMPCAGPTPWGVKMPACKKQEEKEDTMTYNETEATRKYLSKRVSDTLYSLRSALEKQFNLNKSGNPETYKDLIDAIKNGNYKLDPKKTAQIDSIIAEGELYYGSFLDGIKWALPNSPDYDGYTVAEKAMYKAQTAALDVINTADAAAGLKAVQDFEGWTYSPPAASSTSVN